jgi:hypothetical protein
MSAFGGKGDMTPKLPTRASDRREHREAAGAFAEALMHGPHYNGVGPL